MLESMPLEMKFLWFILIHLPKKKPYVINMLGGFVFGTPDPWINHKIQHGLGYLLLLRVYKAYEILSAFQDAMPEKQPDAPKDIKGNKPSLTEIRDPSKFVAAVAPFATADSGAAPACAATEEKKEELAEESDDDMGFILFD
ncbi:hypothetical protein POM88_006910 [Heracleum sosnowskyi]|uniref:Uncharacterized protein n=1 Tax=Heracleum sosnowskyi TaxID=360622 RepID=A0AAD8J6W9_9APIA|nr:hypothetical protein POM88_006910 [Heracleum sosnowskyi]